MPRLSAPPQFLGASRIGAPEKGFPDWPSLIAQSGGAWSAAVGAASGPKVLVASNTGMHGAVSTFDSVLTAALTLAGARVSRTFCDGVLQACLIPTFGDATPPSVLVERELQAKLCKACFNRGTHTHRPSGLPEHRFSDWLKPEDYALAESIAASVPYPDMPSWQMDGLPVGEHAYAGALRYFAKGDISDEPQGEGVARRYLEGAILTAWVFDRLLEAEKPDVAILHHAIYSPQGVAAAVCRKRNVRVVSWVVAYRKSCFIFSHDDTYHHTLMTEPVETWSDLKLTPSQREELTAYLASRADGSMDWIYFHRETSSGYDEYARSKGIDRSKPLISVLTNVMWDAQLHYPANAFPGMKDWIVETVRLLRDRTDLEVAIRIHPAEARGAIKSRQRVADVLREAFPVWPSHIHLIEPEEEASTYDLAHHSNAVIIYGTKMGTELTPLGKPVIVAGEAWIRNKGLTEDVHNRDHYAEILSRLPLAPGQAEPDRERALLYAYHFFFRRMIPLPFLEPNGTGAMFDVGVRSVMDLSRGRFGGLDTITKGILEGTPFIYEAERAPA
ncbi:capsule biosynthesis protein [Hyphomonas sp.]|uniref:capsular polysaccharide export protein, LipB/KpsS family n=1 Tax=Hyphomonas sp. TaxID=87 RepID=UPI001BCC40AC|nr:capsule biosynthesis protein [Hyphomonas sp.]